MFFSRLTVYHKTGISVILTLLIVMLFTLIPYHTAPKPICTGLDEKTQEQSLHILVIGNSLSVDTAAYAAQLAAASGYHNVTVGNCYIIRHSLWYLWKVHENNGNFTYTRTTGAADTFTEQYTLDQVMEDAPWDVVVFNEKSDLEGRISMTIPPEYGEEIETTRYYLSLFARYVKRIYPDASVGYLQIWAFEKGFTGDQFSYFNYDHDTMFEKILSKTQYLWNHGSLDFIVPAGTAMENARTGIFKDVLTRDKRHASYDYGRALAAMTLLTSCGLAIDADADLNFGEYSIPGEHAAVLLKYAEAAMASPDSVTLFQ